MPQPVVHFELWSAQAGELADFYQSVFDWKIHEIPELNYRAIDGVEGAGIPGGIMTPKRGPWPGNTALYIEVDDISHYRDKITEAGGKVIVDEMEVPGVGWMLLFLDPDERPMGIWKKVKSPTAK